MKYIKSFKFWIVFLLLTYAFAGFIAIPWFITNWLPILLKNKASINIFIKKADFNPYSFELTLKDITLYDLKKQPAFKLKRFYIDYTVFGLFEKTFLFSNISLDSPLLYATINQNGDINLNNILPKNIKNRDNSNSKKTSLPSVVVRKIDIKNGQIKIRDNRKNKEFALDLGPYDFMAHDISTDKGKINAYTFETLINGESKVIWKGGMSIEPFKLYGKLILKDLKLPKIYKYALPNIGASLRKGSLWLTFPYQVDISKHIKFRIDNAKLSLKDIKLKDKKTTQLLIDAKNISITDFNLNWPKQNILIDSFKISDANIYPKLQKDGKLNFTEVFTGILKPKKESKNTKAQKTWSYLLKNAKIVKTNIYFDNLNMKKETKTALRQISLHVKNISSNKQKPIAYKINSILNKSSKISISGDVIQKPLGIKSNILLSNILPIDFINYIDPYINFKLKSISIDTKANINATFNKNMKVKLTANSSLNNLVIDSKNNQQLLGWEKVSLNGIKFQNSPISLDIKVIKLNKPYIRAYIAKNHTTNFSNLIKQSKVNSNKSAKKEAMQKPMKLKIEDIKLHNGVADFRDDSVPFPFHTNIHDLNGYITTLDFDSTTPSKLRLDGKIDKYGYADIKGILLPFRIKQKADINVLLKNIDLTNLTPYSGKFLGYKIKNGKMSMDLNYKISKASLIGKNKINIDTLELGQRVDSKDAVNLPIGLALALLKDSNNQIDIDLPVSGDMNNPDFSYGSIVWKAIGNMITGIVTAPFKFLGSILGIKGEDLKAIDFEHGSYKIISSEFEKFENLDKIMTKRPNIKLEIIGGYNKTIDTQELQKQKFGQIIKIELGKLKKDTNATQTDNYGKILKAMYIKKFSNAKYKKTKQEFTKIQKTDGNKNKREKPTLDITALNTQMKNELTKAIKIPKSKLISLANKRANAIKKDLVQKYKLDAKRVKILPPVETKAKRDRWIACELKISI